MSTLTGKIVLISGGTSGIGLAAAISLTENGAKVFLFGRYKDKLDDALSEIKNRTGREATGFVADISQKESIKSVFRHVDQIEGRLDILINNAALPARSILDSSYEDWQNIIDVNVTGYFLCAKLALERMIPVNSGHIINIGSMSAHVMEEGADLYVATKSAVRGFNESLRKELIKTNVKVSLIEPGSVATGMVSETEQEKIVAIRRQKLLRPEDIAEAVLFVATRSEGCEIIDLQLKPKKQEF